MRIAIEAQRIFRQHKHGMDFVILEVLRRLQRMDTSHHYYVFVAPGPDICLTSTSCMDVIELRCPTYPLWEQVALPHAVARTGVDLLHCTSNTAPLHCPVPMVLTLHDIIYLQQTVSPAGMSLYQRSGLYYRRWNVPRVVNRCARIITVSRTMRHSILQYFPQLEQRLTEVYNGYSPRFRPLSKQEVSSVTDRYTREPYFLFLGNTDPRKNTTGVLYAYAQYLQQSHRRCKLMISGLSPKQTDTLLNQHGLTTDCRHQLVCPGYLPEDDMPALYAGAEAFLFSSFDEGFGLPILEAMACGTPVITSRTSAMPEIAGASAILINPQQPQEIADALLRLETDEVFRQKQVDYGLERVSHFSWEDTARKYVQIYESVL